MAKLNRDWLNAFDGHFETEEEVIEFIYENISTRNWEDSDIYVGLDAGNANEHFIQTVEDKKELLYEFMMKLIKE